MSTGNTCGKHGGSRKVLTWEEKLACCERSTIVAFVAKATCNCKQNCFEKIRVLDEKGYEMLQKLREDRLSGLPMLL